MNSENESFNILKEIIKEEDICLILKEVEETYKNISNAVQEKCGKEIEQIIKSAKTRSEIYSNLLETQAEKILGRNNKVKSAKKDNEPDLYFEDIEKPLEIKNTFCNNKFRGGEFSKRPACYLLFSPNIEEKKYFCALTFLKEEDWEKAKSRNYYATSYSAKMLQEKLNKKEAIILKGFLKIGKQGGVSFGREKM